MSENNQHEEVRTGPTVDAHTLTIESRWFAIEQMEVYIERRAGLPRVGPEKVEVEHG